jgi:DNA processing protein
MSSTIVLTEELAAIGLAELKLSNAAQEKLFRALKGVIAIWQASPKQIEAILGPSSPYIENWQSRKDNLNLETLLANYQKLNIHILPISHPSYPTLLKEIHHAPKVLFVKGNISALSLNNTLGIVGTRLASPYGKTACQQLIKDLKPTNATIISGMAEGIDTFAHLAALDNNLPTVAVFGTGLDTIFPSSNLKLSQSIIETGGAWVSEYPLGTRGDKHTFPNRNRIIAGLCQGTLVIEAPIKSGALITAHMALNEGRTVMAVCGNIFSSNQSGCHQLIQQGAQLITSSQDIIEGLNWESSEPKKKTASKKKPKTEQSLLSLITPEDEIQTKPQPKETPITLSNEEKQIVEKLGAEPLQQEVLLEQLTDMAPHVLQQHLLMLEIKGVIQAHAGNHYTLSL